MNLFTKDWGSCVQAIPGAPNDPGVATLSCIWVVIQNVVNAALVLSAVVAVFLIIYSGFQYVTSSGDKEKVDSARKRLTYAIIGLVFIVLSYSIVVFISQFTGVGLNQLTSPPTNNLTPNPTSTTFDRQSCVGLDYNSCNFPCSWDTTDAAMPKCD